MITRNKDGKLVVSDRTSLSLVFDDLFALCNTEAETEWLRDTLIDYLAGAEDGRNLDLGVGDYAD